MAPMMPWLTLLHLLSVNVDLIHFQLSITKNGDLELIIKLTETVSFSHCTEMAVSSFKKCVFSIVLKCQGIFCSGPVNEHEVRLSLVKLTFYQPQIHRIIRIVSGCRLKLYYIFLLFSFPQFSIHCLMDDRKNLAYEVRR